MRRRCGRIAAADDAADDFVHVGVGGDEIGIRPAVPQHHDAVGDRQHVVQPVRDQDDGDAFRTASAAVGSSMMTSLGLKVSARAIATVCC